MVIKASMIINGKSVHFRQGGGGFPSKAEFRKADVGSSFRITVVPSL